MKQRSKTTEEFKAKLKEVQPNLDLIGDYEQSHIKVLVKDALGLVYSCQPNNLLLGKIPGPKTVLDKQEWFKQKAGFKHNYVYDYSKSVYINDKTTLLIECSYHGEFKQLPSNHLQGQNCPLCSRENQGDCYYKNPDNWLKPGCCYLLHFKGNAEEFWKIGMAIDIKKRVQQLRRDTNFLYDIEVQDIIYDNIYNCYYKYEQPKLVKLGELNLLYTPKIKFGGQTECFIGGSLKTKLSC